MDLDYAILADGVTARVDNKVDIYGAGWDTVHTARVPARHPQLSLAVRILAAQHEVAHPHRLEVVLSGVDGAEIARATGEIEPVDEEQRRQIPAGRQAGIGLVLNFQNVVFPVFGAYQLALLMDGHEMRPPLRLFVVEAPQPES